MGFMADALLLIRLRKYDEAAKLLEKHVYDPNLKESSRTGLMSWVGDCYLKAEDRRKAARWFELAGNAALQCKDLSQFEREKRAMTEFEHAMNCYETEYDVEGMKRVATLKYSLRSSTPDWIN